MDRAAAADNGVVPLAAARAWRMLKGAFSAPFSLRWLNYLLNLLRKLHADMPDIRPTILVLYNLESAGAGQSMHETMVHCENSILQIWICL